MTNDIINLICFYFVDYSDMAPNSCGNHSLDHDAILVSVQIMSDTANKLISGCTVIWSSNMKNNNKWKQCIPHLFCTFLWLQELCESVHQFAISTLSNRGVFLCKIWDGKGTQGDYWNKPVLLENSCNAFVGIVYISLNTSMIPSKPHSKGEPWLGLSEVHTTHLQMQTFSCYFICIYTCICNMWNR